MNSVSAEAPESVHDEIEAAPPSSVVAHAAVTGLPRQQKPFCQRFFIPSYYSIFHYRVHNLALAILWHKTYIFILRPLSSPLIFSYIILFYLLAKTGIPTKRFLFSLDVKGITYTLIVVGAGCGWTCKKFWVHTTGGVFGKEIEDDDVGENQGRREGSEDKEDVHFGGLWIENIEEERIWYTQKKMRRVRWGYGRLRNWQLVSASYLWMEPRVGKLKRLTKFANFWPLVLFGH